MPSVPMIRASARPRVFIAAGLMSCRAGPSAASISGKRRFWRAGTPPGRRPCCIELASIMRIDTSLARIMLCSAVSTWSRRATGPLGPPVRILVARVSGAEIGSGRLSNTPTRSSRDAAVTPSAPSSSVSAIAAASPNQYGAPASPEVPAAASTENGSTSAGGGAGFVCAAPTPSIVSKPSRVAITPPPPGPGRPR